jgi:uncharacterized membrane protein
LTFSNNPTDDVHKLDKNGEMLNTPSNIKKYQQNILLGRLHMNPLPHKKKTNFSEADRETLVDVIEQLANINNYFFK